MSLGMAKRSARLAGEAGANDDPGSRDFGPSASFGQLVQEGR